MRISVDIDCSELLALATYYNLRDRYSQEPVMYRTGNNGVHFVERDLPLTWEETFAERRLFRDDANRIMLDEACRLKPMQVLFSKKREERGAESKYRWCLDEKALLALPFWISRIVRKR